MKCLDLKGKYGFSSEKDRIFPPMVVLEITNVCNLECIHCPHVLISKQKDYKPRHMKWETFSKIVEEVSLHDNIIFRLLSDGEPLMHPRFLDMIRLAKNKGITPINFITNGVFLNEEMSAGILEAGVEVVEISLDALTKQTYEKIRKNSDYELVMSNVNRFIELRNIKEAQTKIMVSIIDQPESRHEINEFENYWTPKVDRVIKRKYTSIGGLINISRIQQANEEKRWPCPQLWRRIFINVDGYAEYCVEDWHDQSIIGDVNETSLREIWSFPEYEKIRSLQLLKRFSEIPYCAGCKDWQARDWKYDYFYALEKVLRN
ncbi:MAG: radical SAM protein [Candidatus Omnitrophica bacterium]|nr:radical SAM protein [Candidatus Omnitrophota bacterium]